MLAVPWWTQTSGATCSPSEKALTKKWLPSTPAEAQLAIERSFLDQTPPRRGQFTRYLIEGLSVSRGEADKNGDGTVSTGEASSFIESQLNTEWNNVAERDDADKQIPEFEPIEYQNAPLLPSEQTEAQQPRQVGWGCSIKNEDFSSCQLIVPLPFDAEQITVPTVARPVVTVAVPML